MTRIEEALAKLLANREAAGTAGSRRPIAGVRAPGEYQGELARKSYAGRHIEIDFNELRVQGFLAPDAAARKLADEYRAIKWPLLKNASAGRDPLLSRANLLMIASALSSEGKTFTCINLCLSIARERDWSVVLVDGDCSKADLTRLFGAQGEPGLLDILRDPTIHFEAHVMPTNIAGLSLLPAGTRKDDATELLSSARMDALCAELAASDPKRMIIFDSSPLLLTPEATVLAACMGQIVLVVLADKTPQRAVLSARDRLDSTKAINLLLNQVSSSDGAVTYGYYGHGD
jgi:exopolysaccharide/PEP-CTERM locus tyrosine autokinase